MGVHADLRLIARHQDAPAFRTGGPVQNLEAVEMPTRADQAQAAA